DGTIRAGEWGLRASRAQPGANPRCGASGVIRGHGHGALPLEVKTSESLYGASQLRCSGIEGERFALLRIVVAVCDVISESVQLVRRLHESVIDDPNASERVRHCSRGGLTRCGRGPEHFGENHS